jgi:DnaJ-class molecular chaperone
MAEDYYKTLGVNRDASSSDIQKAYFDLARKYHPDLHPDDKTAKQKFQEVQRAFEVLSDTSKREMYDRYGSAFEQAGQGGPPPRGPRGGRRAAEPGPEFQDFDFSQMFGGGGGFEGSPGGGGGFSDFFSQFRRGGGGGESRAAKPAPAQYEIEIPFQTAVTGGEVQLELTRSSGKHETVAVRIPAGIEDGKKIRLRGQGEPQGEADLLVKINVAPHPYFQRRGDHLDVKAPVTVGEAALGAKIDVPSPHGTITVRVPAGSSTGSKLRVKGQGVRAKNRDPGDLFVEVQVVLPKQLDAESQDLIRQFDERNPQQPRTDLRW